MKTEKLLKFALVLTITISLFSCNKNEDPDFQIIPEVATFKKVVNDTTRYALAYYVYSNLNLDTAYVITPGSETIQLAPHNNSSQTFSKVPGDDDYSTEVPTTGDYDFTAISYKGEQLEDSDDLAADNLGIPEITAISFNENNTNLDIEWNDAENADNYFVRILKENGDIIYNGYEVDGDSTNYTIYSSDGGWSSSPTSGTNYVLQLNAILYEDNININEYIYHINTLAITDSTFTWDE